MRTSPKAAVAALGTAILTVSLLGSAVLSATPAVDADANLPGWTLQEDVDLSDASRWTLETGQSSNTSSYDLPTNVSFGDAGLTVRGASERHSTAEYTSGDAKGLGITIPNYSRVEAIGSMPHGPGLWPALMWLRPLDSADGEIDLIEVFGDDARAVATIHNEYGANHRSLQGSVRWENLPNSDPTGVHTYVMEKTPKRIMMSVDGHLMLDVGPEDVRPGFDWNAIFERPGTTWYPRVTLQIGCAPLQPNCGIGLPPTDWKVGTITLSSLKIWRLTNPGEQRPAVESGVFELRPGEEIRHAYSSGETDGSEATVAFTVPKDIDTGVLYQSLQVRSTDDGRDGYRATVTLKAAGTLRLTLASVHGNRSTVLSDIVVAGRSSYQPGDSVHVSIRVVDGKASAKTWVTGAGEPNWQLTAKGSGAIPDGDGVILLGYLSQHAPIPLTVPWSGLSVAAP